MTQLPVELPDQALAAAPALHAPALLDYHPDNLRYALYRDEYDSFNHPHDPDGNPVPAVGVHGIHRLGETALRPGGEVHGLLMWHECELAHWTGTRAEFAAADRATQATALAVGPAYNRGRWGTHLGATMTVLAADDRFVFRSRAGKYAEDHLYDSLVAGTMLADDETSDTDTYLRRLTTAAGVAADSITEFHPTHLAMRGSDFGLWIGGWLRTDMSSAEVALAAPFETIAVPRQAGELPALTEWGAFDLAAALGHVEGNCAFDIDLLP